MQKTFALFCLPLLLCVFIFSALAQDSGLRPGRVSSESLIVRAKPASYYERLTQLKKGEAVQVLSKKEDWYEILLPESVRAWVRSDSLDEAGQVLGDTCFLSAGAGDFFTPYFHVPQGTRLKRIGAPTDGWTQVQPPENASAWVHADYVSLDEEREASQEDATIADALPGALAKQREELKKEHAKQQELLLEEQQKLALLRQQAEQLQKSSQEDAAGLEKLQREAERLQALKEAAEAKAELARLQREKAGIQAEAEQNKLEALKRQAEEKARSVISEKTKWEEEAKKTALAIEAVQQA
ncbi:MAG: SH3 domain-containing protein, partial [Lentisphaerae bacterium]|nr:SH3 domain-containing protein [Lentisphaerota bacterium]